MIYFLTFAVRKKIIMARVCQVTGKRPVSGNTVSHSNKKKHGGDFYPTFKLNAIF
jgi:hypothetical protein